MAYLLVVGVQKEFVRDDTCKVVYKRCVDYINACGANYTSVIAAVYKNTSSRNMHSLVHWDEMKTLKKLDFRPNKMYLHSGYSVGDRLKFEDNSMVDVIGFDTDACVLSTCFDVFNMDVNFRILASGCWSSGGEAMHEHGLAIMKQQFDRALDTTTNLEELIEAHMKLSNNLRF